MGVVRDRLAHAWNAFLNTDERVESWDYGVQYSGRPDRVRMTITNERSIISSVYTRLAIDVAQMDVRHVRLDESGRYLDDMDSFLNECLTVEANIDQTGRDLLQDIAFTLFDRGVAAVVPVITTLNPKNTASYDIKNLRVGDVVAWHPAHVRVSLYNEETGRREEVTLPKRMVAIITNPLYSVMNEPNSTLQRLIRKLNLLDTVDEQTSSGKLDLIIQLPYVVKSEARREQANQRRRDIEMQLKDGKYGIAYTDGTEKITQLNRPAENNLLKQVELLTEMLYGQLGVTVDILNGTADEQVMLNYYNRTIEPILSAIVLEMRRKFITKTGRTQGQSILFFRDPFKLVPLGQIAEIADKFKRNEIVSGNEMRGFIGLRPSTDPKADQLRNSNMPQPDQVQSDQSSPEAIGPTRQTKPLEIEPPKTTVESR